MLGIVSIAIGDKAKQVNNNLNNSLTKHLQFINKTTLDIENLTGTIVPIKYCHLESYSNSQLSRITKCNLINLIPPNWTQCIYLDADTIVQSKDILVINDILLDGFDLVICPSQHQDYWHIEEIEKKETFSYLGYQPTQLQFGVFGFSINDRTKEFFKQLSNNYQLYLDQDQCALVKTLHETPLKIWLMGKGFNSSNGSIIRHNFGETRNG